MARLSWASLLMEPERDGAGDKTLDDVLGRLDFFERDGGALFEVQQAANGTAMTRLVVDNLGVFAERRHAGDADGLLELGDGIGVPHVVFPVAPPLVEATVIEDFVR